MRVWVRLTLKNPTEPKKRISIPTHPPTHLPRVGPRDEGLARQGRLALGLGLLLVVAVAEFEQELQHAVGPRRLAEEPQRHVVVGLRLCAWLWWFVREPFWGPSRFRQQ